VRDDLAAAEAARAESDGRVAELQGDICKLESRQRILRNVSTNALSTIKARDAQVADLEAAVVQLKSA
jgi:hypothetical protein